MRIRRSTLAVMATAITFAAGGGVAWACGAGSGYGAGATVTARSSRIACTDRRPSTRFRAS